MRAIRMFGRSVSRKNANIIVEIMPNSAIREYTVVSSNQVLTKTPNFVIGRLDVSRKMNLEPMDESTKRLHERIHAISPRIQGVTIRTRSVKLSLLWHDSNQWLSTIEERQLMAMIAEHLEWTESPRPHYVKLTEGDMERRFNALIALAVARGDIAPPPWRK